MMNAMMILQTIDQIFTTIIFLPMIFILYCRITGFHKRTEKTRNIYRLCLVLVCLFLLRYFCAKFIYTEVNYEKLSGRGMSPLIRTIFYPDH